MLVDQRFCVLEQALKFEARSCEFEERHRHLCRFQVQFERQHGDLMNLALAVRQLERRRELDLRQE